MAIYIYIPRALNYNTINVKHIYASFDSHHILISLIFQKKKFEYVYYWTLQIRIQVKNKMLSTSNIDYSAKRKTANRKNIHFTLK